MCVLEPNDPPTLAELAEPRIHGYAVGDRVRCVRGEQETFGKVTDVYKGCEGDCKEFCHLIWVRDMNEGILRAYRLSEVEHAD